MDKKLNNNLKKYLIANAVLIAILYNLFSDDHSMHFLSLIRWAYLDNFISTNVVLFIVLNAIVLLVSPEPTSDTSANEQEDGQST